MTGLCAKHSCENNTTKQLLNIVLCELRKPVFSANYAKCSPRITQNPLKSVKSCAILYLYTVGREKYTLLRILTARTYKIYKERVDNDDETADNGLPASQSVVLLRSFAAPFCIVLRDNKGRKVDRHRNSIDLSCDLLAYHSGLDPGDLYRFHIEQAQA